MPLYASVDGQGNPPTLVMTAILIAIVTKRLGQAMGRARSMLASGRLLMGRFASRVLDFGRPGQLSPVVHIQVMGK